MNNMPIFNSYTVADHKSGEVWRITKPTEYNPDNVTKQSDASEQIEAGNHVHISQQAFDKYKDYAESLQTINTNGSKPVISDGVRIHDPNALSEKESEALLNSLNEDPTIKMYREIAERFQLIDIATIELRTTTEKLEQTYNTLMEQVGRQRPDLKNKSFGFSVSAEGRIVLQRTGSLSTEQIDYLDKAFNGSSTLVKQAINVAEAQIALTKAEGWNKGFIFNRDNYTNTIDLGADLSYRRESKALPRGTGQIPTAPVKIENYWRTQLISNGEIDPALGNKPINN
ncbi:hypothetical protein HW090_10780 [Pseudomonas sp. ABC1]|uniref:hypothetical protein n=1 Tax=Pseudomonas sp. ABC1 TaxID=2748080 RepID=UPI0015C360AD|nr:hypothetical protein [Pseudomonas sp. ABC1]QLF93653.1 hypothetical protein HW090_10780 [Pseudomonas sp. ABC1]